MANCLILAPKTDYIDDVNNVLIDRFVSDVVTYYSYDEFIDRDQNDVHTIFLNTLVPNRSPPHELR